MGWTDLFRIVCPVNNETLILKRDVYRTSEYITPEWRRSVQAKYSRKIMEKKKSRSFQIVVHVRRGDITPCYARRRYLPNSHYMTLIERYLPKGQPAEVTIFSESFNADRGHPNVENSDVFRRAGSTVKLDADLPEVWKAFATADVLIMSRSYFSFVPAIFNPNTFVATKWYGFDPILGWEQADDELVEKSDKERDWLGRNGCTKEEVSANKTDDDRSVGNHSSVSSPPRDPPSSTPKERISN
jgi:hypothetical protein